MALEIPLIGICLAFIIGTTVFLAMREKELSRAPKMRLLAYAVFILGAGVAGWVSYSIVFAPPAIAEGDMSPKEGSLDVTVPSGRYEVVVHGEMDDVHSRSGGTGRYTLEIKEGDKFLQAFDGTLDKHVETRRVMKRGVTNIEVKHMEGRHDLPGDYAGKQLHLSVTKEEGNLKGPMHVMVIQSPPSELFILLVGCLLSLVGAVVDRRMKEGAKSYVGIGAGFYIAFALLVMESTHPLELVHLLAVLPMALLLGAAGGGLFRLIVKPFVKALPGSVPASGK